MIGTANSSHCEDHIHLSFKKVGAWYVDPTRFLEKAYPTLPTWVQQCDDYKLVFKVRERERRKRDREKKEIKRKRIHTSNSISGHHLYPIDGSVAYKTSILKCDESR